MRVTDSLKYTLLQIQLKGMASDIMMINLFRLPWDYGNWYYDDFDRVVDNPQFLKTELGKYGYYLDVATGECTYYCK